MKIIMYADGGARGNPGPAAAGAVLQDSQKQSIALLKSYLGTATNNQAEYSAVILGLTRAVELDCKEIEIYLDSKLIVEQLSGRWKIKDTKMKQFAEKAHVLLSQIPEWRIQHIRREYNTEADALVNNCLDARLA